MMCFSFLFLFTGHFMFESLLNEDRFRSTVTLNMCVFYIERCDAGSFSFPSEKFPKTKQATVIALNQLQNAVSLNYVRVASG